MPKAGLKYYYNALSLNSVDDFQDNILLRFFRLSGERPEHIVKVAVLVLLNKFFGAVAQLGERFVRNEQVVGSIPINSTC